MNEPNRLTRDFTVAVFVTWQNHVVLHWHRKLARWLPPGGHIEPDELPDEAAIREVWEETGLRIVLRGERGLPVDYPGQPRQLIRPQGIQLEDIGPGHQHIDLVYFAHPESVPDELPALAHGAEWIAREALAELDLTEEIRAWLDRAFADDGDPSDSPSRVDRASTDASLRNGSIPPG
ncbi:MAG TPA: NUDIX domain-containing protein [Thermomicrobiales bacterium]|nr:NUDIX domain-containing protein [Thermomicrobiales bacterium]